MHYQPIWIAAQPTTHLILALHSIILETAHRIAYTTKMVRICKVIIIVSFSAGVKNMLTFQNKYQIIRCKWNDVCRLPTIIEIFVCISCSFSVDFRKLIRKNTVRSAKRKKNQFGWARISNGAIYYGIFCSVRPAMGCHWTIRHWTLAVSC